MPRVPIAALLALVAAGFLLWWNSQNVSAAAAAGGDAVTPFQTPDEWPTGDRIWDVCRAIAHAEGYDVQGAAPQVLNNPGDLSPGDENGFATAGPAEYHGGSYLIHFATPDDGWGALYAKFKNILASNSRVYAPDMSWQQIGTKYAADPNWGLHVAAALGVSPLSTLNDYVGGL